jgi:hypothetical protein
MYKFNPINSDETKFTVKRHPLSRQITNNKHTSDALESEVP